MTRSTKAESGKCKDEKRLDYEARHGNSDGEGQL